MNKPYTFFKESYNQVIPLDIYQTWHTKDLPPKMRERVELLKNQNPRFTHHLYDDNDCREFIKAHFKPDVLYAYDTLIPGAYKADLFRLCILFIKGGIYMDIKLACVNGFRLIELCENNHFVLERPYHCNGGGIHNAFIVSKAGNIFLYKCIRQIVKNVKNKYYGIDPLSPTGPRLLFNVSENHKHSINVDMFHLDPQGGYIVYKNILVISTEYPEYNEERTNAYNSLNTKRYDKLWHERKIYK
jgi:mannosyltransferase OCH1-like enzyme